MSEKISNMITELKALTLFEAVEFVKEIEKTFEVDASTAGGVVMMGGGAEVSTEPTKTEEKTEFDVSLEEVPADKKIAILKVVRTVTELGLKEAKEVVENAPKIIKESLPKTDAEEAKKQLEEAGATVVLK